MDDVHHGPGPRGQAIMAGEGCDYKICRYNICISDTSGLSSFWNREMPAARITRDDFLRDRQGRAFTDILDDPAAPFDALLQFFGDEARPCRMEESEAHHDRPAVAGIIRELEAQPEIDAFLSAIHLQESKRFRHATGALVRMIMERRGWKKTGRKGSIGVRARSDRTRPSHNLGSLDFWFIRTERYELRHGLSFCTVPQRDPTDKREGDLHFIIT